jgi:hypothetical protein
MAEIEIEKKSNNNWIWIILGLIVLGIILYFVVLDEDAATDDDGMEQVESQEVGDIDVSKDWKIYDRTVIG